MSKILLIEDDPVTQKVVAGCLQHFEVTVANCLKMAREILEKSKPDLILLDVQLPDGDGFSFFVEIQNQTGQENTPIIFLTGRNQNTDKVTGYSLGAEDYITKPVDPLEFRARIEAKLRKQENRKSQQTLIRLEGLTLNLEKQTAEFQNGSEPRQIELTNLEFKLLVYLLKHKDHVLSRDQLIQSTWGQNVNVSDRVIDSHISHLRKHLQVTPLKIQSVYGAGYRLSVGASKRAA